MIGRPQAGEFQPSQASPDLATSRPGSKEEETAVRGRAPRSAKPGRPAARHGHGAGMIARPRSPCLDAGARTRSAHERGGMDVKEGAEAGRSEGPGAGAESGSGWSLRIGLLEAIAGIPGVVLTAMLGFMTAQANFPGLEISFLRGEITNQAARIDRLTFEFPDLRSKVETALAGGEAEPRETVTTTAREAASAEFDRRFDELTMTALRLNEVRDVASPQRRLPDGRARSMSPLRPRSPCPRLRRGAAPSSRTGPDPEGADSGPVREDALKNARGGISGGLHASPPAATAFRGRQCLQRLAPVGCLRQGSAFDTAGSDGLGSCILGQVAGITASGGCTGQLQACSPRPLPDPPEIVTLSLDAVGAAPRARNQRHTGPCTEKPVPPPIPRPPPTQGQLRAWLPCWHHGELRH